MLIADAAQNAMAGEYKSIVDGLVLISMIVGWTVLVDRVAYFVKPIGRLMEADRVCLVRDGVVARRAPRREYLNEDELMSQIRLKGVLDLSEVRRAYIEPDGEFSVIKRRAKSRFRRAQT